MEKGFMDSFESEMTKLEKTELIFRKRNGPDLENMLSTMSRWKRKLSISLVNMLCFMFYVDYIFQNVREVLRFVLNV